MRTQVHQSNTDDTMRQMRARTPEIGDVLGAFRLVELLGEGGMARVYRAEHLTTGAAVALKVLSADRSMSQVASRNFALEAEATRRIDHPSIVRIDEHVTSDARFKYHVMELLPGKTLREVMDDEAEMDVPRAVAIALELARALAAAHRAGFVHRDVKPENVVVVRDGDTPCIKLIDFGAAKDLSERIATGEPIVGTPLYMAPEQMWGHGTAATTDVYAFGLVAYEMLAGKLPFKARKFVELREERSTQEPTPLRTTLRAALAVTRHDRARKRPSRLVRHNVPAALDHLIMACLARDPAKRPASMDEVAAKLAAIAAAKPHLCLVASNPRPAHAASVPQRLRTALGYAAAAIAVFVSSSTLVSDVHARGPRETSMVIAAR